MNLSLHSFIKNIFVLIGLVVSTSFLIDKNLSLAFISLALSIFTWIFISLLSDDLNVSHLNILIAAAGCVCAIIIFFFFAVEALPLPEGAIIFHPYWIAVTLGVFLLSCVPVIYNKTIPQDVPVEEKKQVVVDDEFWEEASDDDLESGDYTT